MNDIKKAASVGANDESSRTGQAGTANANLPDDHSTITSPPTQGLADTLPAGQENAVDSETLMQRFHLSDRRQLRALVSLERSKGALILTAPGGGYFMPDAGEKGRREIRRFISTIRAKGVHTLAAAKPALRALRVTDGQITLSLDEALDAAGLREFGDEEAVNNG